MNCHSTILFKVSLPGCYIQLNVMWHYVAHHILFGAHLLLYSAILFYLLLLHLPPFHPVLKVHLLEQHA